MDILKAVRDRILFFDGAMGTMIQRSGLKAGQQPEVFNIIHPEVITSIHKAYLEAGADIITANTFGANQYKLTGTGYDVEQIVKQGVSLARRAAGDAWVALDIGPVGQLMEPSGTLSFDHAYEAVARQIRAGAEAGADLVIIETIADLYEMKAAVLAVKENSSLPVFCTLTFDAGGRTMMGTDPLTAVNVLEGLGVDAIGANCSLGPKELLPIVKEILKYAQIPVLVQPNAGLPRLENGETIFDTTPEEFASYGMEMLKAGVRVIGGCCGTDPEFIKKLKEEARGIPNNLFKTTAPKITAISSASNTVIMGQGLKIIGGRINSNKEKSIEKALEEKDFDTLVSEAIEQKMAGADILGINIEKQESHGGKEDFMAEIVMEIQGMVNMPIMIESEDPQVIERAVRIYKGKPMIKSVIGTEASMASVFPIARKYGACVAVEARGEGTLTENEDNRLEIAQLIVQTALEYGLSKENIIIDPLIWAYSMDEKAKNQSLDVIDTIKARLGVKVLLDITEGSGAGGLGPESIKEPLIIKALDKGLDCIILDPLDENIMEILDSYRL